MTDQDRLLTVTEAAELLRVPVATLRWWRHKDAGPRSFKLGRHVLYQLSDLDAWVAAQRINSAGHSGAA